MSGSKSSLVVEDCAPAPSPCAATTGGTMAKADDETYFVIPLSIQPDGDDYLVGNADLDDYYQIPAQGLAILEMLRKGDTPTAVKAKLAREALPEEGGEAGAMVDVDDFVAMLREIGFLYPIADAGQHRARVDAEPADRRILFKVDPRIARAIFSPVTLLCYVGIVGYALALAVRDPALRIDLHAFFIERNFAPTLVLLLLLSSAAVMLHELGHMLAAARHGISSRLGIGNRLWNIVAEADLSGVLALPKRQRYLPLMAGMMVDVLVIALVTLAIAALVRTGTMGGGTGFTVQLLQALILQIIVTITWQFNFFLKTDIYYALSNYWSYPDLDADARIYLRDRFHRLSNGRFGARAESPNYKNLRVLNFFSVLWVVGRLLAFGTLVLVFIPTIYLYGAKTYRAYRDPAVSVSAVYDLGIFTILSLMILVGGLYMWLRGRWATRRTLRKES
jgi:putative peptide zinc metalloprotease protein